MEAIILAGGLGSRLASVLNDIPKAMAPIGQRPFLELLFDRLDQGGVKHVLLSVGYLHHVIQEHFGPRYRSLDLEYIIERTPLGTGGAVRLGLSRITGPRAFVLNGDTLVGVDYRQMDRIHTVSQSCFSMAVCDIQDTSRYGQVTIKDGRVVGFSEKKNGLGQGLINAGVYLMDRDLLNEHPLDEVFSLERDYLVPMAGVVKPLAFITPGPFIDIGIPEYLEQAQRLALNPL